MRPSSLGNRLAPPAGMVAALVALSCGSGGPERSTDPDPRAPAVVERLVAHEQEIPGYGPVDSLAVRVLDRLGNPLPNVRATWTVSAGGGLIFPRAPTTDASGVAKAHWELDWTENVQSATVSVADLPAVEFNVRRVRDRPAFSLVSGGGQTATVGTALPQPVVVLATHGDGTPWAGLTLALGVGANGAVDGASVGTWKPTDADGRVAVTWTLGPTPGEQTMHVSIPRSYVDPLIIPLRVTATALPATP